MRIPSRWYEEKADVVATHAASQPAPQPESQPASHSVSQPAPHSALNAGRPLRFITQIGRRLFGSAHSVGYSLSTPSLVGEKPARGHGSAMREAAGTHTVVPGLIHLHAAPSHCHTLHCEWSLQSTAQSAADCPPPSAVPSFVINRPPDGYPES